MGHAVSVSEKKGQIRLDNYERHFLAAFLDDTGRFYAAESQAYFERNNQISDYLKKAEARLVEEDQRCERGDLQFFLFQKFESRISLVIQLNAYTSEVLENHLQKNLASIGVWL